MSKWTVLTNGIILTPFKRITSGCVLVHNDFIEAVDQIDDIKIPEGATVIDVKGNYISPGFIDSHLHGAFGGTVMSATEEDLRKMARGLVQYGVTSFLPTTLSAPWAQVVSAVDCIDRTMKKDLQGAKILGVHVEGPHISMEQKGAQNPDYIYPPKSEQYLPFLDQYPNVIRITAAPEVPGGLELGQELRRRNIIAAIGHSDATYQEVVQAVENGYTHVTHMFSGMSGLKRVHGYRVAGVIESTLLIDELTTELIADGHHLPPSLINLVFRAKGKDKVCLVTDSMTAAGLGPGKYTLGGLDVIIEADIPEEFEIHTQENNYVAKLPDRSVFASSVATADQLVRNMVKIIGLNILEAVKLVTYNAAKIQGLDGDIGILANNKKADITVFNNDIDIKLTIVDGEILYQNL